MADRGVDRFVILSGCSGGGKSSLLDELGRRGSYLTQAVLFFFATLWTVQLCARTGQSPTAQERAGLSATFANSVVEGWKFSWRNETVRTGLLVVMMAFITLIHQWLLRRSYLNARS